MKEYLLCTAGGRIIGSGERAESIQSASDYLIYGDEVYESAT